MNKKGLLMALLSLFSSITLGGTAGEVQPIRSWSPIIGLSIGPQWSEDGTAQTRFLAPEIVKTYAPTHEDHSLVEGEIFLGVQHSFSLIQAQLGVAAAMASYTRLTGFIQDDAVTEFQNHLYHYQIRHSQVTLKAKLLADMHLVVTPWISGSAGIGFNNANEFLNTTFIDEALPNPNFNAFTRKSFTYSVGAGIQRKIINHWQIGIGYQFADWGKSQLGPALGQSIGHRGLTLDHLRTNGILFNMTYIG